jgi:hypothetical protein
VSHNAGSCNGRDPWTARAQSIVGLRTARLITVVTLMVAAQLGSPGLATRGSAAGPGMTVAVTVAIGGATHQWALAAPATGSSTAPATGPSVAAATAEPAETLADDPAPASPAPAPDGPTVAPTSAAPQPVTTPPVTPAATSTAASMP